MKKIMTGTLAIAIAIFTLTSCGKNDKKQVQKNAEAFLTAIVKGDFASAKSMVTPETDAKWGGLLQEINQTLSPEAKLAISDSKISISDVKVEGETAEVVCTSAIPYLIANTTILHFQKVGDKWLIHEPDALVSEVLEEKTVIIDTDTIKAPTQEAKSIEKAVEKK